MKRLMLSMAALWLSACGGLAAGGQPCTQNAECDHNLACVAVLKSGNSGCQPTGAKVCTKKCSSDAECYGGIAACKAACSGELLCAAP